MNQNYQKLGTLSSLIGTERVNPIGYHLEIKKQKKRTPEQMSIYLRVVEKHKRKRVAFVDNPNIGVGNSTLHNGSNMLSTSVVDDSILSLNLGALSELVKDGTRNVVHQTPQQVQGIQSHVQQTQQQVQGIQSHIQQTQPQLQGIQSHIQGPMRQPQQISRHMHSQIQQMLNSQNLALQQHQQQWEQIKRRQQATPRPVMNMDNKERPMVEVKVENPSDFPMDHNAFNNMNSRYPQLQQYRQQQQLAAMAQNSNAFRSMSSLQIPQIQSPNMGMVRAPPVKVEGFQELMGGDVTLKHDSEENKLMSPK